MRLDKHSDMVKARHQAQKNADYFGKSYAVFIDTSGSICVERLDIAPTQMTLEVFTPGGGNDTQAHKD